MTQSAIFSSVFKKLTLKMVADFWESPEKDVLILLTEKYHHKANSHKAKQDL